ncbi:MAG: copper chaperone PCu(A)C [Rhodospirillales bacterium]|nr:copper chaperone PCu(A)C [Rhodospirillales bacterium]
MIWLRGVTATVAAVLALVAMAMPAAAHEEMTGDVTIVHPWSRPAPQGQNGVIYLDIRNDGAADDRLIAVGTPLATKVELHKSAMEDGIHRMEKVESIVVPAGGAVELAPGGLHVMLVGLKFMLMAEETIPVTFTFERAGDITTGVAVEVRGGADHSSHDDHDQGHSDHGHDH